MDTINHLTEHRRALFIVSFFPSLCLRSFHVYVCKFALHSLRGPYAMRKRMWAKCSVNWALMGFSDHIFNSILVFCCVFPYLTMMLNAKHSPAPWTVCVC